MPNCSHSSLTVNRPLCANITNRIISSIGLTVFQDIMLGTVTHHPGSFVTYHSGSHLPAPPVCVGHARNPLDLIGNCGQWPFCAGPWAVWPPGARAVELAAAPGWFIPPPLHAGLD